jgi:hypothetical protein
MPSKTFSWKVDWGEHGRNCRRKGLKKNRHFLATSMKLHEIFVTDCKYYINFTWINSCCLESIHVLYYNPTVAQSWWKFRRYAQWCLKVVATHNFTIVAKNRGHVWNLSFYCADQCNNKKNSFRFFQLTNNKYYIENGYWCWQKATRACFLHFSSIWQHFLRFWVFFR